jgi:hypothetical protein
MSHWLKAMGFWIWGLIAIGLSASLVSVSYRLVSMYRSHAEVSWIASGAAQADSDDASELEVAPRSPMISHIIAKEMTAATKAMQAGQWTSMIQNLEIAESKSPLTTFDKKTIDDFKGYAYIKLKNCKAAEAAYEAAMATGGYNPEEIVKKRQLLFRLAVLNRSPKAIDYGKQIADAGSATSFDLLLMSQVYYQQNDCKESSSWGEKAIAAARMAGDEPKELLYQMKLQCADSVGDSSATIAALHDLVRLTNKTIYWNSLIRRERQTERDDHSTLMIYRIMYDTGAMDADTDYIEMAELLGDAGLPAEAYAVLGKATRSGLLKDDHRERVTRLLDSLKSRAETDALAASNPDASADAKIKEAEVRYGAADYGTAIRVIKQALEMGHISHVDEAYVYLGRSQLAVGNVADAKNSFALVKSAPNVSPRIAALWDLYADSLGR